MNQPLIDNGILVLAFTTALLFLKFLPRRRQSTVASLILLFAPLVIFFNMCGHIVAVLIVNYKRYISGVFEYNFHFYSLLLFGLVFASTSAISVWRTRKFIQGGASQKNILHTLNGVTSGLFLPLIFFNPIAMLPIIASAVSSLTIALTGFQKSADVAITHPE